jgi:hypothetical protein
MASVSEEEKMGQDHFESVFPGDGIAPKTAVRAEFGQQVATVTVVGDPEFRVHVSNAGQLKAYTDWLNAAVVEVTYMAMLRPVLTDQWLGEGILANLSKVPLGKVRQALMEMRRRGVAFGQEQQPNVWVWRLSQ